MAIKSLEELKQENLQAEQAQTDMTEEEAQEVDELESNETEGEEPESNEVEGEQSEEVPEWLQADDEQGASNESNGVPVKKHVDMKHKFKGQIQEKESEIESLKAKIEQLEKGVVNTPQGPTDKPTLEQFDGDVEKYTDALLEWKSSVTTKQAEREKQQAQQKEFIESAVNSHYERAAKLAESENIDPVVYQQADSTVRRIAENTFPGHGEQLTDNIIANLGPGSEKVLLYLGRNNESGYKFQSLLKEDPSGLKAMVYLGQLQERFSNAAPKKKTTSAPKPGTQLSGEGGTTSEKAALRKYKDAHKKGDVSEAWRIKRQAKAAGVNTKNW